MHKKTVKTSMIWRLTTVVVLAAGVVLGVPSSFASAQQRAGVGRFQISEHYNKTEYKIPMRDGVKLHTVVFTPKNDSKKYPFLINRSPYSCRPYGKDVYPGRIGPSKYLEKEGFIFVKQDVRGRWNSEGKYDNMRPHVPGDSKIDESSDTYDTIEWLLKNVKNNNGKAGIYGISYPGFYSAAALPEHHPALVASSPQAPISDFFFDDFHHHGAYLLGYFMATNTFGFQHDGPTTQKWYPEVRPLSRDAWSFYTKLGPLSNADSMMGEKNEFWKQLSEHPNYDEFWQKRSILPHLKNIKTNVMTVGGWYDAEDLYGPLNIYKNIEKNNPDSYNVLVMGPWSHGAWSRPLTSGPNYQTVGNLSFGKGIADFYQKEVEYPFFMHFLKGVKKPKKFEALVFDTGKKKWDTFKNWPPTKAKNIKFYLNKNGSLSQKKSNDGEFSEFVSDPFNPVPYRARKDIRLRFTPRPYMTDDQRFATEREDVLTFQTDVLEEDLTISGDILAHLMVSTTGSSADWIVKVVDVYPNDHPDVPGTKAGVDLKGYQQMVRSEVIRGRFRNGYDKPEAFVPNKVAKVNLPLQDIHHTFKKGHRVMIHVQSTWFPLIDINPQTYVDNIFKAKKEHFKVQTHRVYHTDKNSSWIEMKVLDK